ncbi:MAG: tail fiber domain-containing protein [Phycisphaerales bacterium]|nr:MAG: tail fiber domain-containing protein [Phycisphaerales bacterium]
MYTTKPFGLVLVAAFLVSGGPASGQPTAGTAFTFQGKLEHPPGTPATGVFDFCFTLYDACTDGNPVGGPIYMDGQDENPPPVTVTDGIFTVDLDFGGDVFDGDERCLGVEVREGDPDPYIELFPRQHLRPTPYALYPLNPHFSVITGSGTQNRISKFDGPQSITDSNIYDDGESVDIGVPVSTEALDVNGDVHASATISSDGNIHASGTISSGSSITIDGITDTISATTGTISFDDENLVTTGKVGIGPASASDDVKLDVNGKARIGNLPTETGTLAAVYTTDDGVLCKLGSSKRYKTCIADLDTDPDAVLKLNPVRFQWKTTGGQDIGLIAEEVDEVIKDLVAYDQEGRPDAVKYDRLSLYLLAVLKELKAENDAVKERLEALERKALRQQPVR